MARIISASRRTDVPAFYSEWFLNRIRAGCVRWANPFSLAIYETSLRSEDVMALVFVSKNYLPLLPKLDELDRRGYRMLFHFTINGLPTVLEPRVPRVEQLIKCAKELSARYGPDAVLWRYDPIVISSITDRDYHIRRFSALCESLEGITKRCYFSFAKVYRKVERNYHALRKSTGVICHDIALVEKQELAAALADIAREHGIRLYSCCGDDLVSDKISKGHCIDPELLHRLYPDKVGRMRKLPTRGGCGCCECTDIGAYDTCPHGCVYCYANVRADLALRNYQQHDPRADILGPCRSPKAKPTRKDVDKHAQTTLNLGL